MAIHRFWYAKNGHKDVHIPLLNYWYFSYRVFKRLKKSDAGKKTKEENYKIGMNDLNALNTMLEGSNIDF
jgi:hypothetical protein